MTDSTPYDDERGSYSREALARLVLSDRASGLSEAAGGLAVTRYDRYTGPGGRVSEALQLARIAERLLAGAVVYERERGSSWEDIARYLDVEADVAQERFSPDFERWNSAFDVPYRLDETGSKRIPQLPTAAYDPHSACRHLDLWANVRLSFDDKHAVSAGLRADVRADATAGPAQYEIDGRIGRRNLEAFLALLSQYVGQDPDEADGDIVKLGLETTDDEDPGSWYSFPMVGVSQSLEIRLANAVGSDVLSVVVGGADSAVLRLRIDTLLAAL
ncbi:hypothetical protein [Streptomyces sp. NPDC058280]|uniref:hypothetical protein n=1 Tax=Streptomyces sp. NPDC058280 TaxID=3346419 RepID=UPI0036E04D1C